MTKCVSLIQHIRAKYNRTLRKSCRRPIDTWRRSDSDMDFDEKEEFIRLSFGAHTPPAYGAGELWWNKRTWPEHGLLIGADFNIPLVQKYVLAPRQLLVSNL